MKIKRLNCPECGCNDSDTIKRKQMKYSTIEKLKLNEQLKRIIQKGQQNEHNPPIQQDLNNSA